MERHVINSDETVELACVIKAICDGYDVSQEELQATSPIDSLVGFAERVKFKKRIPVNFPIPSELAPKGGKPVLRIIKQRSIFAEEYVGGLSDGMQSDAIGKLGIGLGEFELRGENRSIQFWCWHGAQDYYILGGASMFFIRQQDLYHFTKTVKRLHRNEHKNIDPPVLPNEMLVEIYNNSIGFLLKGKKMREEYRRRHIPYKRGMLFCGRAGSGKTLTCKWLRELCTKSNLSYRIITMENYREAISRGRVHGLFRLPPQQAGIIFFDDMDVMVKNRKESVNTHELSTFLSELDGIETSEGVVYVFTTNYIEELDEAFVRPGRIDLWLPFYPPTEKLRREFVTKKFDSEILEIAEIEDLVILTKEYTFAEIEEIRKLFCMDLMDDKELNVDHTFKVFNKHRKEFASRAAIHGFGSLDDDDDDYEDLPGAFEAETAPWRR